MPQPADTVLKSFRAPQQRPYLSAPTFISAFMTPSVTLACLKRLSSPRDGNAIAAYNMPPTRPTKARVPRRTLRDSESDSPRHGCACARSPSTSEASFFCNDGDVVASTNDSSVSRLAEREFRFVEPNKVRTGSDDGVGRTQIPGA